MPKPADHFLSRPRLSHNRSLLLSVALIIILTAGHLLPSTPSDPLISAVRNALHFAFFGLATLTLLAIWRPRPCLRLYIVVIVGCLVIGSAGEASQLLSGKAFDLSDLVRDMGGAAVALTTYVLVFRLFSAPRRTTRSTQISAAVICLVALTILTAPFLKQARALQIANANPHLILQPTWWSEGLVQAQESEIRRVNDAALGSYGFLDFWQIGLHSTGFSGIQIALRNGNWSEFDYLVLRLRSNANELDLVIRIDDAAHTGNYADRYNARLNVTGDQTEYRIPLTQVRAAPELRQMDLHAMQRLLIFTGTAAPGAELAIGSIELH